MERGIHPSAWFTAEDFTPEGRDLIIERVESVEIEPGKSKQTVFFRNEKKSLVLNEGNLRIIEKNTGKTNTDEWSGFHIRPYSSSILMKGEVRPCIRIKIEVNKLAKFSNKENR